MDINKGVYMHFEQYGKREDPIIVFLHGANFVHSFGRQYSLADDYCLIVPHIMGYGKEAHRTFHAEEAVSELAEFIKDLGKKVTLVGFSLGAQLAIKLVADYEELFRGAIIVSPWLIKEEPGLTKAYQENAKQLKSMKNKFFCKMIGLMNGLPRDQRREFADQMQNVSEETLRNTVYNDITLETVERFSSLTIPVIVLAGGKEQREVTDSVLGLERMNKNCKVQIWDKAGHNIPPLFHKDFNQLIRKFMKELD